MTLKGRLLYSNETCSWHVGQSGAAGFTLSATALMFGTTTLAAIDNILKFNERRLRNALDVINRLEPIECDQTHDLAAHYTPDTPQSHQCGFIAQKVQQIDELKYAVAGGEIDEQGKETIRYLNYNPIFAHAVKAIQELSHIVKETT